MLGAGRATGQGNDRRVGGELMFRFDHDLRIYLHREPIDFRAGLNTLVMMVEQSMQLDPLARAVFGFHNRKRDRVKLLLYDRAGFWLMLKRLEVDRFAWPPSSAGRDRTHGRPAPPAARRHRSRRAASASRPTVLLRELRRGIAIRSWSTTTVPAVTHLRKPVRRRASLA